MTLHEMLQGFQDVTIFEGHQDFNRDYTIEFNVTGNLTGQVTSCYAVFNTRYVHTRYIKRNSQPRSAISSFF